MIYENSSNHFPGHCHGVAAGERMVSDSDKFNCRRGPNHATGSFANHCGATNFKTFRVCE